MPINTFFIQKRCDRCNRILGEKRKISFLTKETLCEKCPGTETKVKKMVQEKFGKQAKEQKTGRKASLKSVEV